MPPSSQATKHIWTEKLEQRRNVETYFKNLSAWFLLAIMFMIATYQRRSDAGDMILIQDMVLSM